MSRRSFLVACLVVHCLSGIAAPATVRADSFVGEDWEFFVGNFQFTLLHELGHAFLAETDIPVLGDEEGAVDELASITLLLAEGDRGTERLLAAADGWLLEWGFELQSGHEPPYWDERPLKIQRFYQIVCMIFGADPGTHPNWRLRLPYERSESCVDDYRRARHNLSRLRAHHQTLAARAAARIDGPRLEVLFEEPTTRQRQRMADALRASQIIEHTVGTFTNLLPLTRDLTIVIANGCEAAAYWREDLKEIIVCYALIEQFMYLARFRHCVNFDTKSAPRPRPPDSASVNQCLMATANEDWLPHWPVPTL